MMLLTFRRWSALVVLAVVLLYGFLDFVPVNSISSSVILFLNVFTSPNKWREMMRCRVMGISSWSFTVVVLIHWWYLPDAYALSILDKNHDQILIGCFRTFSSSPLGFHEQTHFSWLVDDSMRLIPQMEQPVNHYAEGPLQTAQIFARFPALSKESVSLMVSSHIRRS